MKGFSRTMPPAPEQPWTASSVFALFCIAAALIAFCYFFPPLLVIIGCIAIGTVILSILDNRRLRQIAIARPDESICTFARSFERHSTDPWITRAVWQEFQSYLSTKHGEFPIRASDQIEEDYRIDSGDVEDMAERIALRTGRLMERTEENPYYDQVHTVGDLVRFINHQPKIDAV